MRARPAGTSQRYEPGSLPSRPGPQRLPTIGRITCGQVPSLTSASSIFRIGSGSPRMIATEASTLRAASRYCQASVNPASRANCAKKARCARPLLSRNGCRALTRLGNSQPPDEHVAAQAAQAVFIVQLAEDDGCGGPYVLREAEHGALGDGHRPDLAGPLV